ncbi:MAG: hypothetical protein KF819_11275 [Labilithrix sp.]|nr:hypothetical protein [Labilithrix sp.]
MKTFRRVCGLAAALTLLAACESSSGEGTSSGPGGPGPTPGNGEQPGEPGGPDEPACVAPTSGPTIHQGDVEGDEVWTAAGSPHVVAYDVRVRNGAKLTIEPCADVQLAKKAHIQIAFPGTPNTGALVAEGTAKRPIKIHGQEGARWASLYVHAPGTARLAHVTFEGGGGGDFEDGATLHALGDGVDGSDPIVFVDNVTIEGSFGTGAWIHRGASFIKGSKDLTIAGSGAGGASASPYPIEISEHALDSLPNGRFTGNADDRILLDPEGGQTAGSGILEDATIHERGVPYLVGRSNGARLNVGGRPDGKLVTATIEPGVVMQFRAGGGLNVQHFTTEEPSTAALRAIGTAAKPIVLTSAKAAPAAGDWRGVWFGGALQPTNAIEHVRIEYAGGDCGCILLTCSNITEHEGAIIFTAPPPAAFVKNTTFFDIAGHAITEGYDGGFVDFRPTNVFESVAGCEQTRPRENPTTCPAPRPACD